MSVQTSLSAKQVCTEPAGVMNQEGNYINILSRAFGYWQTGSQLIINSGSGVLTYQNTMPPQSADQTHLLAGPTWYLVSYQFQLQRGGIAGTIYPIQYQWDTERLHRV